MSVVLAAALSIVVKKSSVARFSLDVRSIGDVASSDDGLVVLGPFFETDTPREKLDAIGLEYYEDYFDIPHTGGPVPDWCQVTLALRTTS